MSTYPRVEIDSLQPGDHVYYRAATRYGKPESLAMAGWHDSVTEIVRGQSGRLIGIRVGTRNRLVARERIIEAWRSAPTGISGDSDANR